MNTARHSLADAIRIARRERGWTQTQLGNEIGVHQSAISLWERDVDRPDFAHLVDLLLALPALVPNLTPEEMERLRAMVRLERELFDGRCACEGCQCTA